MSVRFKQGRVSAAFGAAFVAAGVVALSPTLAGAAAPPQPTYATATVDGSAAEWSAGDVWGTIVSNDAPNRTVASASLRYDCDAGVLYVLVTASAGETFQTLDPAETYVRLGPSGQLVSGLSGNDGTPPDFSWIDPVDDTATGFEASASVEPGTYTAALRIHSKLPDDSGDGYETVDLTPRYSDLTIACPVPTTPTTTPTSVVNSTLTSVPGTTPPTTQPAPKVLRSELARTGSHTGELTAIGLGLVVMGAVLALRSRSLATPPMATVRTSRTKR